MLSLTNRQAGMQKRRKVEKRKLKAGVPGGGGLLPYMDYIGMCCPKGYGRFDSPSQIMFMAI